MAVLAAVSAALALAAPVGHPLPRRRRDAQHAEAPAHPAAESRVVEDGVWAIYMRIDGEWHRVWPGQGAGAS